jgi:hypothetical protein
MFRHVLISIALASLAGMAAPARAADAECQQMFDYVLRALRSGATVPPNAIGWSISAEARIKAGEPCPGAPEGLAALARANPGAPVPATARIVVGETPDMLRWRELLGQLDRMSVVQRDRSGYGVPGYSAYPAGTPLAGFTGPTELEKLANRLGTDKVAELGRKIQFQDKLTVDRYCAVEPVECQRQRNGFQATNIAYSAAWSADPEKRAEYERKNPRPAASPTRTAAGSNSRNTGSQIVTVRQYDRNGNYLGSTVTTSTDASLMSK